MTAFVPPYSPSLPDWQRQVATALNPALGKIGLTVSPTDIEFGAIGDGIADDTAAVLASLSYAFANGIAIDGHGKIFAVSGDLSFTGLSGAWIRSLQLTQLNPSDSRKTLYFTSCQNIRIDYLQINRGSSKSFGYINGSGALWIDGGTGHRLNNVEVTGSGQGNGIVIWNATNSLYGNFYVHDMEYDNSTATDDVLQGIWLVNNVNCSLRNPSVSNLFGNANVSFPVRFTRGIVFGGCQHVSVVDPHVSDVDQGVDFTGSDGNLNCSVIGGHGFQCTTSALKFADSAYQCKAVGFTAQRCGMMGFLISGPAAAGLTYKTSYIDLIGCTAIDVGYNNVSFSASRFGYSIEANAFDTSFPNNCRIIDCRAIDLQGSPTMTIGFRNNIAYTPDTIANNLINCLSQGHTSSADSGFPLIGYGLPFPVYASAPTTPRQSYTYFDSTLIKVRTWDGAAWQNHW